MNSGTNGSIKSNYAFLHFFKQVSQGGYPLFAAAIAAVVWANYSDITYDAFRHMDLSLGIGGFVLSKSLAHWIDEGLMAIFFFTVGLEIKREFLVGGLADRKKAILPIMAALGGMIFPALIYLSLNTGGDTIKGWAIPMATDIAFSLAILSLLGARVPYGLKLFLTAFAIADDLGAVVVIALFYTPDIQSTYLYISAFFLVTLYAANLMSIRNPVVYIILGIGLWFAVLGSGVHSTIAGVLTAFFIPARGKCDTDTFVRRVKTHLQHFERGEEGHGHSILLNRRHQNAVIAIDMACRNVATPLQKLEHALQPWVSLFILPLFALANAGLVLKGIDMSEAVLHPITMGIFAGLFIGKPSGICLFVFMSVRLFRLELEMRWRHIIGVSFLGGIGFTMALFISGLSFVKPEYLDYAKLGIISSSIMCGLTGYIVLVSSRQK